MRSPRLQHPRLRFLSVLAAAITFAACGDGDSPVDPTTEPVVAAALSTSERIAFVSNRGGIPGGFKMDAQGSLLAPVFLQSDGVRAPAWSWDNKRVAMVRVRWNNGVWRNDIWVVNADGSNGHWAPTQPSGWHLDDPSWSPNGSSIMVTMNIGCT